MATAVTTQSQPRIEMRARHLLQLRLCYQLRGGAAAPERVDNRCTTLNHASAAEFIAWGLSPLRDWMQR